MKFGISVGFWGKGWEFYWGKASTKISILELSGTVLTAEVSIYISV